MTHTQWGLEFQWIFEKISLNKQKYYCSHECSTIHLLILLVFYLKDFSSMTGEEWNGKLQVKNVLKADLHLHTHTLT